MTPICLPAAGACWQAIRGARLARLTRLFLNLVAQLFDVLAEALAGVAASAEESEERGAEEEGREVEFIGEGYGVRVGVTMGCSK
jgi:hypothetical protein